MIDWFDVNVLPTVTDWAQWHTSSFHSSFIVSLSLSGFQPIHWLSCRLYVWYFRIIESIFSQHIDRCSRGHSPHKDTSITSIWINWANKSFQTIRINDICLHSELQNRGNLNWIYPHPSHALANCARVYMLALCPGPLIAYSYHIQ